MTNLVINTKDFGGYKKFNSIIKKILPFVCKDTNRHNLNGIYFEFKEDKTILTAVNGHMLYSESFNIENKVIGNTIIKLEGLKQLIKIRQDYILEKDIEYKNNIKLNGNLYSWIADADFVKYENVIPSLQENDTIIEYTKEDLNHKLLKEENQAIRKKLNKDEIESITKHIKEKNLLIVDFNKVLEYLDLQDNKDLSKLSKEEIKFLESNKCFIKRRISYSWEFDTTIHVNGCMTMILDMGYVKNIMDALDSNSIKFHINSNNTKSPILFFEENKRIVLMRKRDSTN